MTGTGRWWVDTVRGQSRDEQMHAIAQMGPWVWIALVQSLLDAHDQTRRAQTQCAATLSNAIALLEERIDTISRVTHG